jgi:N-methylhydantoinase A
MYGGQSWDSRLPIPGEQLDDEGVRALGDAFHDFYEDRFGYRAPEMPIIVTSVAVVGFGPAPEVTLPELEAAPEGRTLDDAVVLRTDIYLDHRHHSDVPVYDRSKLVLGDEIPGPAVIDDKLGTITVNEGATARVAPHGTLRIDCGDAR